MSLLISQYISLFIKLYHKFKPTVYHTFGCYLYMNIKGKYIFLQDIHKPLGVFKSIMTAKNYKLKEISKATKAKYGRKSLTLGQWITKLTYQSQHGRKTP